jgi:GNAT superfamily N-acetyltransferase
VGKKRNHIIFRNLGDNVPPECTQDCNWQVEYHEGRGFPSGIAWVLAAPEPRKAGKRADAKGARPLVKFVLVADDSRQQGIATRLIQACQKRWANLDLGAATSRAGLALYRKLQPPPTPEDYFNKAFIRRFLKDGGTREQLEALAREYHESLLEMDERVIARSD